MRVRRRRSTRRHGVAASLAAFAVLVLCPAGASATPFAPIDTPGPALDVPPTQLAASLQCSPNLAGSPRAPVLLVPGTGITAAQEYSWNYEPALDRLGIPWCGVTFPDAGNDDMQVNGEYVGRGDRVVRALVYRDGRLVARRVGHRVRRVEISIRSASATIRIVTVSAAGRRRTSTRRVARCVKGRPRTVSGHRHRRSSR